MGGRVVEGTGLENRQARKRLEGSKSLPIRQIVMSDKAYRVIFEIVPHFVTMAAAKLGRAKQQCLLRLAAATCHRGATNCI